MQVPEGEDVVEVLALFLPVRVFTSPVGGEEVAVVEGGIEEVEVRGVCFCGYDFG
jgi:hypothetical protein